MLGETGADSDAAGRSLFGILGVPVEPDAELDIDVVLFRLVFEAQSPSAIAGSMLGARAGARGIREVISSEMWECLNVTAHGLAGRSAPPSASAARLPALHQGAVGAVLRPGRLDYEP